MQTSQNLSQEERAVDQARRRAAELTELRRWFHRHPETSFHETGTAAKIRAELTAAGIPFQTVGETGTVGVIMGSRPGPTVGLRADIDALEVQELNDFPYRSETPGLMHACGHDSHMAALLMAARILQQGRDRLAGTVKLVFQPGEEVGSGAAGILQSRLVDDVSAFFGLHATPSLRTGQISIREGTVMAGSNFIRITLRGKGGHAATPHRARDAVVAGSAVVMALQSIVSRETAPVVPAVVTIGMFRAGTRGNIIADRAELTGTARVTSETERARVADAVRRVVAGTASAYGVEAEIKCERATGIVSNSAELVPVVRRAARAVVSETGVVTLPVCLTTDDFYQYRKIAPAFYALVGVSGGTAETEPAPLHSGAFCLDEEALPIEAALHVEFVRQFLAGADG